MPGWKVVGCFDTSQIGIRSGKQILALGRDFPFERYQNPLDFHIGGVANAIVELANSTSTITKDG